MPIRIDHLTFHRRDRAILRDIRLLLQPGAVTAVLGPNGAGKSTLLECIVGLLKPSSGTVSVSEVEVATIPSEERARKIAFLQQTPEIAWPIDVENLVALGRIPHQRRASAQENAAAVQRAMKKTHTAQWAKQIVTELSGGERARVLLARLFATEARWILADEPFAGLDPLHQFEAADLLREFTVAGGGVVLTVHDLSLAARIADRVVLLNDGRVVADDVPEVALNAANLREVYGVDTEWLRASAPQRTPVIAIRGRSAPEYSP